jgi:hypothetical protein
MAISSVKTSSIVNGFPKDRSLLAGNMTSAEPSGYVAVRLGLEPYLAVYRWYDGFGRKYPNAASLPSGSSIGFGIKWSKAGNDIAYTQYSAGVVSVYSWSNLNGFGAKHTSFSMSLATDADFNPGDTVLAISSATSPYIHAYPFTSGVGVGTKYANPATILPASFGAFGIKWSPSGNDIAIPHNLSSPWISVYPWSNGFGTKYANPATVPTGGSYNNAWSPSGNDIAVAHNVSPYISVYPWSNGFGTKYANPATLPTGNGNSVAWSPSGNQIVITYETSPYISVYSFTSGTGFGTKYADPADLFSGELDDVKWNASGNAILFTCAASPHIGAYSWSNGFQRKHDNPADIITSYASSIDLK